MLSLSATFAADEDAALSEVDNEVVVDEDVLSVEEITDTLNAVDEPVVEADDSSEVLGSSQTVTNATFHDYFDEDGKLKDSVEADELVFEGDFTTVDVKNIVLEKSIKLTGNNAIFSGVSFVVSANNIVIDGFKLYQDNDTSLFDVGEVKNVTISNNVIEFKALKDTNSFAIYSYDVELLKIINNNITYVGNTNGTFINNAIYVEGNSNTKKASKSIVVDGNNFNITIPSIEVNYATTPYTTYSEGIVFFFCEGVNFTKNTVDLKYNSFELGKISPDSIYAVSVKSNENVFDYDYDDNDDLIILYPITSKNIIISDNTFNVLGHNCSYAVALAADNFTISNNKFNVSSESYYANAITLNNLAANGEVKDNNISVNALDAVYGIYSYQMGHPITDIVYKNNTINAEAYLACGFELYETNPIVDNNTITTKGNYTYGIVLSLFGTSTKGSIINNIISNLGSNIGVKGTNDPLAPKNSMAITVKSSSEDANLLIKENNIFSTNIGINVVKDSEEVTLDNNTIIVTANNGKVNNYAISADDVDDLTIKNNNVTFTGIIDNQFVIIGYDDWGYPIYNTTNNTFTYGVFVKNSNVIIKDNDFDIAIPTFPVNWGAVRESFSEGIVLVGCDDLVFVGNDVDIKANGGSSWDTIYGIDVSKSSDPVIRNNNITLDGAGYSYGIIIEDEEFLIKENNITVSSDNYACCIDVEGKALGNIDKNNIKATATNSAYPIYSGMNYKPVDVDITNNNVTGEAYYVVGMELGGTAALIKENEIKVTGNYTMGIASTVGDLAVGNNTIVSKASNEGTQPVPDSMGSDTTGIKVAKGNFTISGNDIETTGEYAAILGDNNGTITNNQLLSNAGAGNDAIIGLGNVNASGNPATKNNHLKVIIIASDLTKVEGSSDQYIVKVLDENGKAVANKTVEFILNGVKSNVITDFDGVAKLDVNLAKGEYSVTAKFVGDAEYGSKSITNNVVVNAKPVNPTPAPTKLATKITAKKKTFKAKKKTKKYSITLKDSKGKAVSKVKVTLKVKGKTYKATTNAKGKATFKIKNLKKKGSYKGTVKFAGNSNYKASSAKAKIKVKK